MACTAVVIAGVLMLGIHTYVQVSKDIERSEDLRESQKPKKQLDLTKKAPAPVVKKTALVQKQETKEEDEEEEEEEEVKVTSKKSKKKKKNKVCACVSLV